VIKFFKGLLLIFPLHLSANSYVDLLIQEESSLWISLFALAIISMMSLYLSSEKLKELDKKHKMILKKEKEVEKKQQFILEFMSGKIETSTKGIIQRRESLEKNIFEDMNPSLFKEEIEKFQESEALLLDATQELIDFLKIKSGSLELKNETYKVSNILNETFSMIHDNLKTTKTELIYDVSTKISSLLKGDSKRMEQILSTLLHDAMNGTYESAIILKLSVKKSKLYIDISNKKKVMLEDELNAILDNYTLKEEYKSQDKLYMYIAHQLILQMKGSLTISSTDNRGTLYHIELPYSPSIDEKSILTTNTKYKDKRIFICVNNDEFSSILFEKYSHYQMSVDLVDKNDLANLVPKMSKYDVCILDNSVLDYRLTSRLEVLEGSKSPVMVVLKNIYDDIEKENILQPYELMYKPLQNEQLLHIIETALIRKNESQIPIVENIKKESSSLKSIFLKDRLGITRESFKQFAHLHILIVEDNSMNQKILKGVFSRSGMTIIMANNGLEAVEIVKNNAELDLIFMDTNMPVMDGYEATKQIRKIRNIKMLPIVAIDSIGFTQSTQEIEGINAFLHKPFKIGQLYTALVTYTSYERSSVKHVQNKLTKYKENKQVLDIQKGISHANTAIFYKEVLKEIYITLQNSDEVLEEYVMKAEHKELKSFVLDSIRLAEIIGAIGLRRILIEVMQTFDYKQENKLQDYLPLYKKELRLLKSEVEEYLKT